MKNKIYVFFGIWDFSVTHEEITRIIGFEPQYKTHKGDLLCGTHHPQYAKENCWKFESPFSINNKFAPIEDHLDAILSLLYDKIEMLEHICRDANAELSIIIYSYSGENSSTPPLHFDRKFWQIANRLNMDLDIDIMFIDDEVE